MRVVSLLLAWVFSVFPAISEEFTGQPIIYLAEINSFEYEEAQGITETDVNGEIRTVLYVGCGSYKAELEVLESTVPISQKIQIENGIGEWCRLDFIWPYDLYLIIAEDQPDNILEIFPASSDEWLAYTQLPPALWSEEFIRWVGPEMAAAFEPKPLDTPLRLYLYELPRSFLEAFACFDDELEDPCAEDKDVKEAFVQIVTFDGPVATFHKAIPLDALFPEMAEDE